MSSRSQGWKLPTTVDLYNLQIWTSYKRPVWIIGVRVFVWYANLNLIIWHVRTGSSPLSMLLLVVCTQHIERHYLPVCVRLFAMPVLKEWIRVCVGITHACSHYWVGTTIALTPVDWEENPLGSWSLLLLRVFAVCWNFQVMRILLHVFPLSNLILA